MFRIEAISRPCALLFGLLLLAGAASAQIHIEPANPQICAGESVELIVVGDDPGNPPTSGSWSPQEGLSDPGGLNVTAFPGVTTVYTVETNAGMASVTVTVLEVPPFASWSGISDLPFCASGPPVALFPDEPGGVFTASPAAPGAITNPGGEWFFHPSAYPAGEVVTVTYTLTNPNGCSSSYGRSITIFPLTPVTFTGLSPSFCSSDAAVVLEGSPSGGVFSTDAPSGLFGDLFDPAQAPTGTTYDMIYTLTEPNGCVTADTQTFVVNQAPSPFWSGVSDEPFCASAPPIQLFPEEGGGVFTASPNVAGALTNNGGNWFFNLGQYPGGGNVSVTYTITANGCTAEYTRNIIILALPAVEFSGLSPSYCADDVPVTLAGDPAGGVFSTNAPSGLSGDVLDPSQVPTGTTFNISYTITGGNGCTNTFTRSFIVRDLPVVNFSGLSATYCANNPAVILSGSPAGGVFSTDAPSGLSGNTLTPAAVPAGPNWTLTYSFTNANGCSNTSSQVFTVNAIPAVSFSGLDATYCANDPVATLLGSPAGGTFTTNAPAGLSGDQLDPAQVPAGTNFTLTYTYADANGCTNTQTQTFRVDPLPTVNFFGLADGYCTNSPDVTLNGVPAGGVFSTDAPSGLNGNVLSPGEVPPGNFYTITYTYTGTNGCSNSLGREFFVETPPNVGFSGLSDVYCPASAPVTLTGSPAGGIFTTDAPAGLSGNVLTPGQVPLDNTYAITYTYTDGNGCMNTQTKTFIVTASPNATIENLDPVYCVNETAVTLSASPAGGVFSTDAPAGLSGNVLTPSQVPTGIVYSLNYSYTDGNGCSGIDKKTFLVTPLPVVSFSGLAAAYCENAMPVTLTGNPAGGVFTTDAPAGLTGNQLNPAQVPADMPFSITYTYADANGCENNQTQTFQVTAVPTVTLEGLSASYCADDAPVTLTGNPAGGVFTTDAPGGLNGNLLNPAQVPAGTTFGVTYSFTDANGCVNTDTRNFLVHPLPAVSFSGLSASYCVDAPAVTLVGQPAGGVFSTNAPSGLNGNVLDPGLTPTETVFFIRYDFTDANGCSNQQQQTFTVHPLPTAGFSGLSSAYCANDPVAELTGVPAGGVFSTNSPTGLTGNLLDPAQIETGIVYSLTYEYTDGNGCVNADTQVFLVNALPAASFSGLSASYCVDADPVVLTGEPAGGAFVTNAPAGLDGNVLTPGTVPAGVTYQVSYVVTSVFGCMSNQTQAFFVHPPVDVSFDGLSPTYCNSDPAVTLTGEPSGGIFDSNAPTGLSAGVFDPAQAPVNDTYQITYTFTDANGCTFADTQSFIVFTPPVVFFAELAPEYCSNEGPVTLFGNPEGGVFTSTAPTGFSGNVLTPALAPTGQPFTITYSFTAGNGSGCSGSEVREFIVHQAPEAGFSGLSPAYCADEPAVALAGSPAGGVFSTDAPAGLSGNVLTPGDVPAGTAYELTYVFTDANTCSDTAAQMFTVNALPAVSFSGLDAAYCSDADPVVLSGTPAGGQFATNAPTGLNDNVLTPAQTPAGAPFSISYSYTDANGCSNVAEATFVVNALPTVGFSGLDAAYCADAPAVTLTGTPAGGVFSTTAPAGLNGGLLDPAQIPTGTVYAVAYAYTDANGCDNTSIQNFQVNALPVVSFSGLSAAFCANAPAVVLSGTPAGGSFSGNTAGLNGNVFDPGQAAVNADISITYTYTDANGCSGSQTAGAVVQALPAVSFAGLSPSYCRDDEPVVLTGTPAGGTFFTDAPTGLNGDQLDPAATPPDVSYQLAFAYTDGNGCADTAVQSFIVYSLPVVSLAGLAASYCDNAEPALLAASPSGGVFGADPPQVLFDPGAGTAFQPGALPGGGTAVVQYTFTAGTGCSATASASTAVLPAPNFELADSALFCAEGLLQPAPVLPDFTYQWSNGASTPDLLVTASGSYELTVSAPNGCTETAVAVVEVNPGEDFVSNLLVNGTACSGDTLHFFDISEVAEELDSYYWDFGDGQFSVERDPTHVYAASGDYLVTLEGTLDGCSHVSVTKPVTILECRQGFGDQGFEVVMATPNPSNGDFRLHVVQPEPADVRVELVDAGGRPLDTRYLRDGRAYDTLYSVPDSGVYFLRVQKLNKRVVLKMVVVKG